MNQISRPALLFLLLILLTACGTSSPGDNSGFRNGDIAGNSSATLGGDQVGTGTSDSSDLRKSISYTVVTDHPDLTPGTAYLTRRYESSESASLLLPVTNDGTKTLCFVKATGITYRQGTTALTDGSDLTYADGSVANLSGGIYTNSCLGAGETGYLIDTPQSDPAWSNIDNLVIELLTGTVVSSGYAGQLEPTGYTTDELDRVATIAGTNQGSTTLYPTEFSKYILLDGFGEPLTWSYLDPPGSGSLLPGSSGTWVPFLYGYFGYDGSTSSLRVHFDYSGNPPTATALQEAGSLSRAELLQLREERAVALEQQIRSPETPTDVKR